MTENHERLLDVHLAAADYYAASITSKHGAGPRDYLARRGFSEFVGSAIWCVGYAPRGWTGVTGHLRGRGFTDSELLAAGLAITTRRGTVIDRFRDRISLGLRDDDGRLVGFIGRAAPAAGTDVPKYLNSPRTPVFDKSSVLFGLSEQQDQLAAGAVPVVVEGPLDVLAIARLGPASGFVGVSPSGTALTRDHARNLAQACGGRVVVAFDGDAAGRQAARRAYPILAELFAEVRTARLPAGQDPADLAVTDPSRLAETLGSACPLADELVDEVLSHYAAKLDNAEARVCALHEVSRVVARLRPTDVGRQVARISNRLGLPAAEVTRDVVESVSSQPTRATSPTQARPVHRREPPARGRSATAHQ